MFMNDDETQDTLADATDGKNRSHEIRGEQQYFTNCVFFYTQKHCINLPMHASGIIPKSTTFTMVRCCVLPFPDEALDLEQQNDYLEPFREHDEFRMGNWIETRSWQTFFWFVFLLMCGGSVLVGLCYFLL